MGCSGGEFLFIHATRGHDVRSRDHTPCIAREVSGRRVNDSVDRGLTVSTHLCWRFVQHFIFNSTDHEYLKKKKKKNVFGMQTNSFDSPTQSHVIVFFIYFNLLSFEY